MELQQVRYFLALCKEQNFTRAAKRCGVSQPSLSNAIRKLERELGGPLFHRNRISCRLSDLGQEMRPHLARLDQCANDAPAQAARFLAAPRASAARVREPSTDRPEPRQTEVSPRVPPAPAFGALAARGAIRRIHHAFAVAAVILVGISVKLFFFAAPTAEADSLDDLGLDVSRLHRSVGDLPAQKVHDLSLVFPRVD